MSALPSLDTHAHISVEIEPSEVDGLGVVFAATRTLDEAQRALMRDDSSIVWGVGCHPGLVGAHKAFDREEFERLVQRTAYVAEVGLDGKSRVAPNVQRATLESTIAVLRDTPRIVSIHSYAATGPVIDVIESASMAGVVLHWWLGSAEETQRAIDAGCYFSFNPSSVRRSDLLEQIPLERLLPETDHPFGDRKGGAAARPGNTEQVERAIAKVHAMTSAEIRRVFWLNLARIVRETGCGGTLPRAVRRQLIAI